MNGQKRVGEVGVRVRVTVEVRLLSYFRLPSPVSYYHVVLFTSLLSYLAVSHNT